MLAIGFIMKLNAILIAPGTRFEDLPDDYVCPVCGVGKDMFSEQ